jgi:hypothetical protein
MAHEDQGIEDQDEDIEGLLTQEGMLEGLIDRAIKGRALRITGFAKGDSPEVCLLVDGVGSSSCDRLNLMALSRGSRGFYSPAYFSYNRWAEPYEIEHTLEDVALAAAIISEHLRHYSPDSRLCLVGYSLGGIVVSYWLTHDGLAHADRIDQIVLVSAPLWSVLPRNATLRIVPGAGQQRVRKLISGTIFDETTYSKRYLEKTLVIRCVDGTDGVIINDAQRMSFTRRGYAVQEETIDQTIHRKIPKDDRTSDLIRKRLTASRAS